MSFLLWSDSTFNPRSLTGLAVWLDAQDAASFTYSTGQDVSAWADKSGNSNTASQGTAGNQPLYVASGINGKPAVQFYDDSTAKFLSAADSASMDYTTFTMFVVYKRATDLGAVEHLAGKYITTGNQREFRMSILSTNPVQDTISADGTGATVTSVNTMGGVPTGYAQISEMTGNGTTLSGTRNTWSGGSTGATTYFNGTGAFTLGGRDAGADPFSGYIGEVIFYNRALSDSEKTQVYNYLSSKWTISLALQPWNFDNLAVWMDARDSNTFTFSTGQDISAWADKSGQVNNAAQGTGSLQPLYVAASPINSLPAVQFYDDSTLKNLTITDSASLNYTTFTAIVVMRPTNLLGANMHLLAKWTIGTPLREFKMPIVTGTNTMITQGSVDGTAVTSTASAGAIAIDTNYIVEGAYDSTNLSAIVNNGTVINAALASIFNGTSNMFIGTRDTNTEGFAGYIGEVIFYNVALSAPSRLALIQSLAQKWGITIS